MLDSWLLTENHQLPSRTQLLIFTLSNGNRKKLVSTESWDSSIYNKSFQKDMEELVLAEYILGCRWFAGKSSTIKYVRINTILDFVATKEKFLFLIIEVHFKESFSQHYLLPIGFISDAQESHYALTPYITRVQLGKRRHSL